MATEEERKKKSELMIHESGALPLVCGRFAFHVRCAAECPASVFCCVGRILLRLIPPAVIDKIFDKVLHDWEDCCGEWCRNRLVSQYLQCPLSVACLMSLISKLRMNTSLLGCYVLPR